MPDPLDAAIAAGHATREVHKTSIHTNGPWSFLWHCGCGANGESPEQRTDPVAGWHHVAREAAQHETSEIVRAAAEVLRPVYAREALEEAAKDMPASKVGDDDMAILAVEATRYWLRDRASRVDTTGGQT